MGAAAAITFQLVLREHRARLLVHVHDRHAIGAGVAWVHRANDDGGIGYGVAAEHVTQNRPVRISGGFAAPAIAFLVVTRLRPVHVLAARSLRVSQSKHVGRVLPPLGLNGTFRHSVEPLLDHCERIHELLHAHERAALHVAAVVGSCRHPHEELIAVEGMVETDVAPDA